MRQKRVAKDRKGAAVVELAICAPLLVLLAFGTIGANSMIYFKQSLKVSAYEGARISLIPEVRTGQVIAQCERILRQRRIQGATVTVSPSVEATRAGEIITVAVTAPCEANGLLASLFFGGQSFTESVSMMKEN